MNVPKWPSRAFHISTYKIRIFWGRFLLGSSLGLVAGLLLSPHIQQPQETNQTVAKLKVLTPPKAVERIKSKKTSEPGPSHPSPVSTHGTTLVEDYFALQEKQSILVEWGGEWWTAEVKYPGWGGVHIHYSGWEDSFDEFVTADRIRIFTKATVQEPRTLQ